MGSSQICHPIPITSNGISDVVVTKVACGGHHTLALDAEGRVRGLQT